MVDTSHICLHCEYMERSSPLAQLSVFLRQLSAPARTGSRNPPNRHSFVHDSSHQVSALGSFRCARFAGTGFTLIELLVVVAIIAILAALTLGTLGYVNKKGAETRARAEVAALSAAIDAFKIEFGSYPASNVLYGELTGDTSPTGGALTNRIGKAFFEPSGQILDTNVMPRRFVDPWGDPYNYTTNATNNVGFFDLWTSNNAPDDPALWIRN